MKINLDDYLTVEAAGEAMGGANKRAVYRAINRARAAGETVTAEIFGRMLVLRSKIAVLKTYYYPYGSPAQQAMSKKWGAEGGRTSGVNKKAKRRRAPRA